MDLLYFLDSSEKSITRLLLLYYYIIFPQRYECVQSKKVKIWSDYIQKLFEISLNICPIINPMFKSSWHEHLVQCGNAKCFADRASLENYILSVFRPLHTDTETTWQKWWTSRCCVSHIAHKLVAKLSKIFARHVFFCVQCDVTLGLREGRLRAEPRSDGIDEPYDQVVKTGNPDFPSM